MFLLQCSIHDEDEEKALITIGNTTPATTNGRKVVLRVARMMLDEMMGLSGKYEKFGAFLVVDIGRL